MIYIIISVLRNTHNIKLALGNFDYLDNMSRLLLHTYSEEMKTHHLPNYISTVWMYFGDEMLNSSLMKKKSNEHINYMYKFKVLNQEMFKGRYPKFDPDDPTTWEDGSFINHGTYINHVPY